MIKPDHEKQGVWLNNEFISLKPMQMRIITILHNYKPNTVTIKTLQTVLNIKRENTLSVHLSRSRFPERDKLIETVYKIGYRIKNGS